MIGKGLPGELSCRRTGIVLPIWLKKVLQRETMKGKEAVKGSNIQQSIGKKEVNVLLVRQLNCLWLKYIA